jgi:hypothetical protein
MKLSTIFKKAAKIISDDLENSSPYEWDGCCAAIERTIFHDGSFNIKFYNQLESANEIFKSLFKEDGVSSFAYWFGDASIFMISIEEVKENQLHRIIALLFASEYAKSIGQ